MYDATVPFTTGHDFTHEEMGLGIHPTPLLLFSHIFSAQLLSQRPESEHTDENKALAISYAALRVLECLWEPYTAEVEQMHNFMRNELGLDPDDNSKDVSTPIGIGNTVGQVWVDHMYTDGVNQMGDEHGTPHDLMGTPYVDYTNCNSILIFLLLVFFIFSFSLDYPVNRPQPYLGRTNCSDLVSINHWQQLMVPTADGGTAIRPFLAPYMKKVRPFALHDTYKFYPPGPPLYGTSSHEEFIRQHTAVLHHSALLTDYEKVVAEFWADGEFYLQFFLSSFLIIF